MSLVRSLLPQVDAARQLVADLGLRPYRVQLRRRAWSGGRVGAGSAADVDIELTPPPVVDWPTEGWLVTSGKWGEGDLKLKKVSPTHPIPWLMGEGRGAGEEHLYVLCPPDAQPERCFRPIGVEVRPFEFRLRLVEVDADPADPTRGLVTYRARLSRSFQPAAGTAAYTEETTLIRGRIGPIRLATPTPQGARTGDVTLRLLAADLPRPPRPDDRFDLDGQGWSVHAVEQSLTPSPTAPASPAFFTVHARRS